MVRMHVTQRVVEGQAWTIFSGLTAWPVWRHPTHGGRAGDKNWQIWHDKTPTEGAGFQGDDHALDSALNFVAVSVSVLWQWFV